MRKRLLKLSGAPFSSTAPLGEVRYEVPAPNVGPTAASPLKAPGDAHAASAAGVPDGYPLNLFLVHLVALGAHQGGTLPLSGRAQMFFPAQFPGP